MDYRCCEHAHSKYKKVMVSSYVAQYPVLRIAQSAVHFNPWQICSIEFHFDFYVKHATINAQKLFPNKHPPLSTARYSFIQLNELE